jgi:biotin carboxyl carrier protein
VADVQDLGEGWYLVTDADRQWRVAVVEAADATWVFCDGQVARIARADAGSGRRRRAGGGDAGVMSPMPATVIAVQAAPGQAVTEGDVLIVLEAMKMELPIRSPRSGTVKAIHCAKGDLVQPGVSLLEVE